MIKILVVLFVSTALAGCAAQESIVTHNGDKVLIEMIDQRCPLDNGKSAGGCHIKVGENLDVIYYPFGDSWARRHELEHVAGMRHGAWIPYGHLDCATVTIPGATAWKYGDEICRLTR